MKKEIMHENQIRFILSIEDLKREKMLPTGNINDLVIYPDRLPYMIGILGVDMPMVDEIEAVAIDGGLVIELKLKSKPSEIKRAYYSPNIDDFYAFLSQEKIDGRLLYKDGNYVFIPHTDFPQVLTEEYYLKSAVTEKSLQDYKVISDNALYDLIKN